jgi:hypothetical protein
MSPQPPMPYWLRWVGLIMLGAAAGLVGVATDKDGIVLIDLFRHELLSIGTVIVGGFTKIGRAHV